MISKKNTIIICLCLFSLQSSVFADNISDIKTSLSDTIAKLIQQYEARIQTLETENAGLKQTIIDMKGSGSVMISSALPVRPTTDSGTSVSSTQIKTGTKYDALITSVNGQLGTILSENYLPGYSVFGLFEFIEPNVFFLSIDDGNNPEGVTAFKTKILYTYDADFHLTKIGLFDLDYSSQKYRTLFWSNPYTKTTRLRVQNPLYKGKLLDAMAGVGSAPTSSVDAVVAAEVTLAQIQTAYSKSKLLDALKLSDVYIAKNPNNLDVLRIRYRSYYIIGKYDDSLAEIKKIETIQGTAFERTIACDAAVIGKIAKKTDVSTYYSALCKKQ